MHGVRHREASQRDEAGEDEPDAFTLLQSALSVSSQFQGAAIRELRGAGHTGFIAPREANSQLGRLFHEGNVNIVTSFDIDLVAHGVWRLIYSWRFRGDSCEAFSWGMVPAGGPG